MGCAPGPASKGRKLQGLSDVTQHGSIWSHSESPSSLSHPPRCSSSASEQWAGIPSTSGVHSTAAISSQLGEGAL